VNNLDGVGTICSRLCTVLKEAGRNDEALAFAHRTREIAETTHNEYLHWSAGMAMGRLAQERGDHAEAERLFREALASFSGEPERKIMGAETQVAIGQLLLGSGAVDAAAAELSGARGNRAPAPGPGAARADRAP
jgi:hypothetical protein